MIVLLNKTTLDLQALRECVFAARGDDLSSQCVGSVEKLSVLSRFHQPALVDSNFSSGVPHIVKHLHFVFLVVTFEFVAYELLQETKLEVSLNPPKSEGDFSGIIVSGTAEQFEQAFVKLLRPSSCSDETQTKLCDVMKYLEGNEGLLHYFGKYEKVYTDDGLFYLA